MKIVLSRLSLTALSVTTFMGNNTLTLYIFSLSVISLCYDVVF